jgi:Rod binding domain-containing protein
MNLPMMNPGTHSMAIRSISTAAAGKPPETPAHKKLRKAAQDFEGILISEMWEKFNEGFIDFGGETPLAGSDTMNSLAVQTLSAAIAKSGGLGIGKMLVHQLEQDPALERMGGNR